MDSYLQIEKIFHGRPSGIDNTVATYGNYVIYAKGEEGKQSVDKFKASETIDLRVLVVDSGVPKDTRQQVANVRKLYERHTSVCEGLLSSVDGIVEKFVKILKGEYEDGLGVSKVPLF